MIYEGQEISVEFLNLDGSVSYVTTDDYIINNKKSEFFSDLRYQKTKWGTSQLLCVSPVYVIGLLLWDK